MPLEAWPRVINRSHTVYLFNRVHVYVYNVPLVAYPIHGNSVILSIATNLSHLFAFLDLGKAPPP